MLRMPGAAAWALNQVAREDAGAVEEWLAASAELREASTHPAEVGGDALRAAMAEHRAATGRLMDVVRDRARPSGRPLSGAMLERVRALLQSAAADAGLAERVRAGRVTEDQSAAEPPPPEPKAGRGAARTTRRSAKRDREAAARRAELKGRVDAARKEAKRLRAEAGRRSAAARAADERLEDARRRLTRSESEADAAREAVKDAEAAATKAERELSRLEARLGAPGR